jgi:class 3 adenylate cyclase/tetratricopeptide (TPR) repeat protein
MICPFCQFPNAPRHIYCGRCGKKLPASGALELPGDSLQGERRVVTVMFADISGFTAMTEQRDAEEVVTLVNAALSQLSQCVYRYDGTIDKYIGDAIMAVFGAPKAHEDDPERALRAALDMQAALAEFTKNPPLPLNGSIDVHVGISTGNVVSGLIGIKGREDYTVMGDAVNLASRLEDLSPPSQIFVSEDTYRRTRHIFSFNDLGDQRIKGRVEPIRIYQALGLRSQPASMRGLTSARYPLVGRQNEAQALAAAIQALVKPQGGIVLVEGDAGIGKSRLVTEVRRKLERSGAALHWLEGRGLSYGLSLNFHLITDVLRHHLGVSGEDEDVRIWTRLEASTRQLMPHRAEEIIPYLAILLGLPLQGNAIDKVPQTNPQLLQERTFAAFGEWAVAVAARRPLVLAFDDMHWADPNSIALIEHISRLSENHPLLIICVSRPDQGSPYWRIRQQATQNLGDKLIHLQLNPLTDNEALELVHSVLDLESLPPELEYLILRRAEGNPLFVEEILRTFIEQGTLVQENGRWRADWPVADTELPETLQGMLTARIDRLDDATKRVVQIAAVIGRVFRKSVLARVVDDDQVLSSSLRQLLDASIIRQRSDANEPDTEYIFKHILTQEAAYQTLLAQQRKVYHREVADALARLYWERGEAFIGASLVATHYEKAEVWPRALRYLERAGDGMRAAFSNQEAVDYYSRALDIAAEVSGEEIDERQRLVLFEKRGGLRSTLGDVEGALADYRRAHRLAEALQDREGELQALNQIGSLLTHARDIPQAGRLFHRALELAQAIQDDRGIADSLNRLGEHHRLAGDFRQAQSYHLQALELCHNLDDKSVLASSLEGLGQIDLYRGRLRASTDKYGQVVDLRRRIADQVGLMRALGAMAEIYFWQGKYAQTIDICLEGFDFISRVGDLSEIAALHTYFALAHFFRGDMESVEDHLLAGLEVARRIDNNEKQSLALDWLSYYSLEMGMVERAKQRALDSVARAEDAASPRLAARARTRLGTALLAEGQLEAAIDHLEASCASLAQMESVPDRAVALYSRGLANAKLQNWEEVANVVESLSQIADRSALGEYRIRSRWLRAQLLLAQDNPTGALGLLEDARALAEEQESIHLQWRIDDCLGTVHRAAGRQAEAHRAYTRAWNLLMAITDTIGSEIDREGILTSGAAAELKANLAAFDVAD